MTILETSREFTVMELYKLTQDPMTETLKEHIGEVLEVTGYVLREEDDEKRVITFELVEGNPISSNSPTVQKSFAGIIALYDSLNLNPYPMSLAIYTAPSSKNKDRNFVDIRLIDAEDIRLIDAE